MSSEHKHNPPKAPVLESRPPPVELILRCSFDGTLEYIAEYLSKLHIQSTLLATRQALGNAEAHDESVGQIQQIQQIHHAENDGLVEYEQDDDLTTILDQVRISRQSWQNHAQL